MNVLRVTTLALASFSREMHILLTQLWGKAETRLFPDCDRAERCTLPLALAACSTQEKGRGKEYCEYPITSNNFHAPPIN